MYVIDSQVHVWEASNPRHPWLPDAIRPMHGNLMPVERVIFAMDAVQVDANVIVVARLHDWDNGYALESVAKYPDRLAVIGRVNIDGPDPDAVMKGWRSQPGMLGFRLLMMTDGDMAALDRAAPLLNAAARHRVPMCIYPARPGAPERLHALVRAHPDLQIVIDHLGVSHQSGTDLAAALTPILAFAAYPNVAIKLSAAPLHSAQAFPFADLWPSIHRVVDAFGVNRVMWGSDLTVVFPHHSYSEAVDYLRTTSELSVSDKEMLLGGALRKVLRWEPTGRHAAFTRTHV